MIDLAKATIVKAGYGDYGVVLLLGSASMRPTDETYSGSPMIQAQHEFMGLEAVSVVMQRSLYMLYNFWKKNIERNVKTAAPVVIVAQ